MARGQGASERAGTTRGTGRERGGQSQPWKPHLTSPCTFLEEGSTFLYWVCRDAGRKRVALDFFLVRAEAPTRTATAGTTFSSAGGRSPKAGCDWSRRPRIADERVRALCGSSACRFFAAMARGTAWATAAPARRSLKRGGTLPRPTHGAGSFVGLPPQPLQVRTMDSRL
jgi:hypothetical protein